jgi:hypothetical protein
MLTNVRRAATFLKSESVVATIAQMTGNELVVEVDADPIRIGFDRQSAVSVCGRDRILIGIQG